MRRSSFGVCSGGHFDGCHLAARALKSKTGESCPKGGFSLKYPPAGGCGSGKRCRLPAIAHRQAASMWLEQPNAGLKVQRAKLFSRRSEFRARHAELFSGRPDFWTRRAEPFSRHLELRDSTCGAFFLAIRAWRAAHGAFFLAVRVQNSARLARTASPAFLTALIQTRPCRQDHLRKNGGALYFSLVTNDIWTRGRVPSPRFDRSATALHITECLPFFSPTCVNPIGCYPNGHSNAKIAPPR